MVIYVEIIIALQQYLILHHGLRCDEIFPLIRKMKIRAATDLATLNEKMRWIRRNLLRSVIVRTDGKTSIVGNSSDGNRNEMEVADTKQVKGFDNKHSK